MAERILTREEVDELFAKADEALWRAIFRIDERVEIIELSPNPPSAGLTTPGRPGPVGGFEEGVVEY